MHGLTTIAKLNREAEEARRIMLSHEQKPAERPGKPAESTSTMFAPVAKINQILEGARG